MHVKKTFPTVNCTSSAVRGAEVSWFAPLCNGDDAFLGERHPDYKSNWENTSEIGRTADRLGFSQYALSLLLPSRARHAEFRCRPCSSASTNEFAHSHSLWGGPPSYVGTSPIHP